jgi:serine phosphatase RsbU (regulator of sigma subunit)
MSPPREDTLGPIVPNRRRLSAALVPLVGSVIACASVMAAAQPPQAGTARASLARIEAAQVQPAPAAAAQPPAGPTGASRAALGRIALGFVLVSAGATALVLALVYRGPAALILFAFGVFSLLYGVRILISVTAIAQLLGAPRRSIAFTVAWINYLLPAFGLLFAEQIRGRGWMSSIRRAWQAAFVLAPAFIVHDAVRGAPWASLDVYRPFLIATMVVLLLHLVVWRHGDSVETVVRTVGTGVLVLAVLHDNVPGLLPWNVSLEVYGVSVFIMALGVVTARRFFADQRELAAVERELDTARTIQASILPRTVPAVRGARMAVRYIPAHSVAGDVYDFVQPGDASVGVFVADVAGHGVSAALIASMATVAFSSQENHAADPGHTLGAINRVIAGHFDARYVTAAYVFLDLARGVLRYSLAGHPPPYLRRAASGQVEVLAEGATVLGVFPDTVYPTAEVRLEPGDRLVLYTDGLTDVINRAGQWFGDGELPAFVRSSGALDPDRFIDALVARLAGWAGRSAGTFEDDVTIVVVDSVAS